MNLVQHEAFPPVLLARRAAEPRIPYGLLLARTAARFIKGNGKAVSKPALADAAILRDLTRSYVMSRDPTRDLTRSYVISCDLTRLYAT